MKASPCFSSYYWKAFECEICKKAYPLVLRTKCATSKSGYRTYNLVDYERPEGNFLVLESLNQEKNTSRIIHIIRPSESKNSFKFGRGHESDLRINDISVSRCHAIIKYKEDTNGSGPRFYLEDNLSKFGTLVLIRQRTPLIPGYNKAVQIGRTVINFSVKAIAPSSQPSEGLGRINIKGKIEEVDQILANADAARREQADEDMPMEGQTHTMFNVVAGNGSVEENPDEEGQPVPLDEDIDDDDKEGGYF